MALFGADGGRREKEKEARAGGRLPSGQSFTTRWKGVRFVDVLDRVKLKPGAEFVLVLAEEGYTSTIPLKDLQRPEVLFAFDHDGEPS